jgi:hypothetical protein
MWNPDLKIIEGQYCKMGELFTWGNQWGKEN